MRDAIGPHDTAAHAPVHDDHALPGAMLDPLRLHQAAAGRCPVAGVDVEVPGPQALGAVVPVAPVRERNDRRTAVSAGKALILGSPIDGSASRLKK